MLRTSPWFWLGAGIAVYDVSLVLRDKPTLSAEFARMVRHPVKRWPTLLVWGALTAHLCDVIPRSVDPIHRLLGTLVHAENSLKREAQ